MRLLLVHWKKVRYPKTAHIPIIVKWFKNSGKEDEPQW
jgi:hypothetical protein